MQPTSQRRVRLYCAHCLSDNVTRDALADWSVRTQSFSVCSLLDTSDCNACGASCPDLLEVEVDSIDDGLVKAVNSMRHHTVLPDNVVQTLIDVVRARVQAGVS